MNQSEYATFIKAHIEKFFETTLDYTYPNYCSCGSTKLNNLPCAKYYRCAEYKGDV